MSEKEILAELFEDVKSLNNVIASDLKKTKFEITDLTKTELKVTEFLDSFIAPTNFEKVVKINERHNLKEQLRNIESQLTSIKANI